MRLKPTSTIARQAEVAERAPRSRGELQAAMNIELLELLRHLRSTQTELVAELRGGMTNSVLYVALLKLGADGVWSSGFRVPMGSVFVANHGAAAITVSGSAPGNGAPLQGVGLARVPATSFAVVNLASANLTVYGVADQFISVQVFAKPQPPVAGTLV